MKAIFDSAKGIVIESFGTGNASTSVKFSKLLEQANKKGKILVNIVEKILSLLLIYH